MVPIGLADDILLGAVRGLKNTKFGKAVGHAVGPLMLLDIAVSTGTAERGHMASRFVGSTMGNLGGAVGGAIGAALPIPGGGIVGSIAGYMVGEKAGDAYQWAVDAGQSLRHVNTGGDYQDTQIAYTQRQRAAQEMSTSLLNARQWLGKESVLMHQ